MSRRNTSPIPSVGGSLYEAPLLSQRQLSSPSSIFLASPSGGAKLFLAPSLLAPSLLGRPTSAAVCTTFVFAMKGRVMPWFCSVVLVFRWLSC